MATKSCKAATPAKKLSAIEEFEQKSPLIVRLSPPWYGWANEVKAIFENDQDITVADLEETDGKGGYVLTIDATTEEKADALRVMLPIIKNFGNINVDIEITMNGTPIDYVAERSSIPETIDWINQLFDGSGDVVDAQCYELFGGYVGFVVCPARIIQFYNDDITDVNGNTTMLFADAARDVLEVPAGVNFCTEAIR